MRERIWGAKNLAPFFGPQSTQIGEAWYSHEENTVINGPLAGATLGSLVSDLGFALLGDSHRVSTDKNNSGIETQHNETAIPAPHFPVLSKLIFTAEQLSVQVHPSDEYAIAHENSPGKTEMWHIVHAERGASVALGLTAKLTPDQLRKASENGEIEDFLNWIPVKSGDTFLVLPGTLHSIGPNLVLCEIQQNSDLTYRFYDFSRLGKDGIPRTLHIDRAMAVTNQEATPERISSFRFPDKIWKREFLVACPYFATEKLCLSNSLVYYPDRARFHMLIFIDGNGQVGEYHYRKGDGYLIPAYAEPFLLQPATTTTAIRSYVPHLPSLNDELKKAGASNEQLHNLLVE